MIPTPTESSAATEAVRARGLQILAGLAGRLPSVAAWRDRLRDWSFGAAPDDPPVWLSCVLALRAVDRGNYGVGALVVDPAGTVVAEGENRTLTPWIRTDHHAEMTALDEFEDRFRELASLEGFTLFTSLECCPMCTVRAINSGIRRVVYAAEDPDSGMISHWRGLPPFYRRMVERREPPQRFLRPDCAPALIAAAGEIFALNEDELSAAVARR